MVKGHNVRHERQAPACRRLSARWRGYATRWHKRISFPTASGDGRNFLRGLPALALRIRYSTTKTSERSSSHKRASASLPTAEHQCGREKRQERQPLRSTPLPTPALPDRSARSWCRGITLDMSGSWRLADSCPLDGGVMPHAGMLAFLPRRRALMAGTAFEGCQRWPCAFGIRQRRRASGRAATSARARL